MGVSRIQLFTNSKLMASQFEGLYQVKDDRMSAYWDIIKNLAKQFTSIAISLKPRNDFQHADALAYLVATLEDDSPR